MKKVFFFQRDIYAMSRNSLFNRTSNIIFWEFPKTENRTIMPCTWLSGQQGAHVRFWAGLRPSHTSLHLFVDFAHALMMDCIMLIAFVGRRLKRMLQKSSFDVTYAWIRVGRYMAGIYCLTDINQEFTPCINVRSKKQLLCNKEMCLLEFRLQSK